MKNIKKLLSLLAMGGVLLSPVSAMADTVVNNPQAVVQQQYLGKGQTWSVPNQWNFTFNSIKETERRNKFSTEFPTQLVVLDFSYENLGYTGFYQDLYFSKYDFTIIDSNGEIVSKGYPLINLKAPQVLPVGTKCINAQIPLQVNNYSTELTIIIKKYNSITRNYVTTSYKLPIEQE